jgi:lipopolysaccharide transport system permease protein
MTTSMRLSGPISSAARFRAQRSLLAQMVHREVVGRYRGSALGVFWSLLTPLLMLGVYTWVFGTIFKARWGEQTSTTPEFAILLFAGLIVFSLFSEVVNRAPGLVVANVSYVKKVIFPLEILPVVTLGSALFHAAVSFGALIGCMLVITGRVPATALALPIVLGPFVLMLMGLGWFLASLGVYIRDISQFLGSLTTALMFVSPVFYPASALPEGLRTYLFLNPVTLPIEQTRDALIWGKMPDLAGLAAYTLVAMAVAAAGYTWFHKTRGGFADVL